jgi:hypothetical protein
MTQRETSMSRDSGEPEEVRRQDGGGERQPLPQSEANRGEEAHSEADIDDPSEAEPTRSALLNQSQVKPAQYAGTSQSGGSDRTDDKV